VIEASNHATKMQCALRVGSGVDIGSELGSRPNGQSRNGTLVTAERTDSYLSQLTGRRDYEFTV